MLSHDKEACGRDGGGGGGILVKRKALWWTGRDSSYPQGHLCNGHNSVLSEQFPDLLGCSLGLAWRQEGATKVGSGERNTVNGGRGGAGSVRWHEMAVGDKRGSFLRRFEVPGVGSSVTHQNKNVIQRNIFKRIFLYFARFYHPAHSFIASISSALPP